MILVTGCAGFIGFHLALRLLRDGEQVVGLDNLNDYYDVGLKRARLKLLEHPAFTFVQADLADAEAIARLFNTHRPTRVAHLAAQAGVRYSLKNPGAYASSNLTGFVHMLEGCRALGVQHLVYASSSSVYGLNRQLPFSVHHNVDHPISLYAASKKANELMAHSYSHLFRLPTTGLRFFTVYGPWGRPDMALFSFTRAILAGEPIDVFGEGKLQRDFTYVDDVIEGVVRVLARPAEPNPGWNANAPDLATSPAPYRIYNIGNHSPVELLQVIAMLEAALGRKAVKRFLPAPPTEVPATCANVADLTAAFGFEPATPLAVGIERFVRWYREYYR